MKKKICITVITFLIILSFCTIVHAVNSEVAENETEETQTEETNQNLEQRRIELRQKIEEAGKNLETINVELTKNLEEINKLDGEIYEYEEQVKAISESMQNVEKQIKEAEVYLKTIEIRYNHQKELLQKRIAYWYEAGSTRYLDVLLNSKSIIDFIDNYYLIGEIAEYDNNLLKSIEKQKKQIENIKEGLSTNKENLKVIKAEQKKVAISLENAKVVRNSYINSLTNDEIETRKNIELYQSELDLVDLEILMTALENNDTTRYVGGTFAWPAPGYYTITSPYSMRLHPIIKVYRLHTGMDIGAPMGSYAIAANDGIVTKATYSYSYGNMVMIDHGGGVSTLYAHGSEILVNVGDVVKRGDPVLKVGSTGWSTGPHLHFEIRINGNTIDPYPFVTRETAETNEEQ